MAIDFSLPSERVIRALNQIIEWRDKLEAIIVDNGPEYISGVMVAWAEKRDIAWEYILPCKSPDRTPALNDSTAQFATFSPLLSF